MSALAVRHVPSRPEQITESHSRKESHRESLGMPARRSVLLLPLPQSRERLRRGPLCWPVPAAADTRERCQEESLPQTLVSRAIDR